MEKEGESVCVFIWESLVCLQKRGTECVWEMDRGRQTQDLDVLATVLLNHIRQQRWLSVCLCLRDSLRVCVQVGLEDVTYIADLRSVWGCVCTSLAMLQRSILFKMSKYSETCQNLTCEVGFRSKIVDCTDVYGFVLEEGLEDGWQNVDFRCFVSSLEVEFVLFLVKPHDTKHIF